MYRTHTSLWISEIPETLEFGKPDDACNRCYPGDFHGFTVCVTDLYMSAESMWDPFEQRMKPMTKCSPAVGAVIRTDCQS